MVLALLGVMVLVATISPPERGRTGSGTGTQSPVPQAPRALVSNPDAFDVSATLSAEPGAKQQTVEAELGDRVHILVDGSGPDSVALGDLRVEALEAGSPASFELLADTPGTYPLVLVDENRRIGTLEIH